MYEKFSPEEMFRRKLNFRLFAEKPDCLGTLPIMFLQRETLLFLSQEYSECSLSFSGVKQGKF